ncbi:hypothetical protein CS062_14825 [Roseateles chitinivorans]|uniref:Uncharacterized protein n=1 Tax=Roseateles chitinivorans TaxID=2917965 RepID=A0A2G9C7N2_9BURK|nr:hypothetical protein [Roseateles chitinivorans]PIM52423.1 hypothetical protein CS062_14825 [Roseateles chitinivorans]
MSKHLLTYRRVNELIGAWEGEVLGLPEKDRYTELRKRLYKVRNAGFNGYPKLDSYAPRLIDDDDATMAAVEHYFLCRAWVGTGKYPAWQMRAMNYIYDAGKSLGLTPQHNPHKAVSPLTPAQRAAKEAGILDGEDDLRRFGNKAPLVGAPPKYW